MIKLGPFSIDHPFMLAPMAGITNSAFRRLMRRQGASVVISELISATGMSFEAKKSKALLEHHPEERPVGLQIFGEEIDRIVTAAQMVENVGADFLDLNLGCPVPKVVKKGGGSALCRNPTHLRVILENMVRAVKIPVTIKIRTGWDSKSRNGLEVVKVAYDAGVSWVAIHGRTREQAYTGDADWNFIAEIKSKSPLPIIGNGDVTTAERAVYCLKQYEVDAVMIGRGALRNPFIFRQAETLLRTGVSPQAAWSDYENLFSNQKSLLSELNDYSSLLQSKKFLNWYAAGFPESKEFKRNIFQMQTAEEVWNAGYAFFKPRVTRRQNTFMAEPFLMGGHG